MSILKTIALSSLLILSAKVQAQISIPVKDVSLDYALSSQYAVSVNLGGTPRTVYSDPFKIAYDPNITGISSTLIKTTALWFCMDPLQTIYYNQSGVSGALNYMSGDWKEFNVFSDNGTSLTSLKKKDGLTLNEITDIANLFARNYAAAVNSSFYAAALQIAIWEVVNENSPSESTLEGYDLGNGDFKVSNSSQTNASLISSAQTMLNTRTTAAITSAGSLDFLIDGTYTNATTCVLVQDLVGWAPAIPESSNFAIGALGLLGLSAIVKMRRKTKAAVSGVAA